VLYAFSALLVLVLLVAALYVYAELKIAAPTWRRLPSRPGLPPDMEYQCWSTAVDFDPEQLSDAVVQAVDLLSPVLGRTVLFGALRGSRLLVYRDGTYPGSECGPAVSGVVLTPRWAAVEVELLGVAHAIVHLVERHSGSADYGHMTWAKRGLTPLVAAYEDKRARLRAQALL
jgi:hypothetical protein